MVKHRKTVFLLVVLLSVGFLSGCSDGRGLFWSDQESDFVGVWVPDLDGVESDASVEFRSNGDFSAKNFPSNLSCGVPANDSGWVRGMEGMRASNPQEIDWGETIDFDGTWDWGGDRQATFQSETLPCYERLVLDFPSLTGRITGDVRLTMMLYLNGFDDEWNFVTFKKVS